MSNSKDEYKEKFKKIKSKEFDLKPIKFVVMPKGDNFSIIMKDMAGKRTEIGLVSKSTIDMLRSNSDWQEVDSKEELDLEENFENYGYSKITEGKWIDPTKSYIVLENASTEDYQIYDIANGYKDPINFRKTVGDVIEFISNDTANLKNAPEAFFLTKVKENRTYYGQIIDSKIKWVDSIKEASISTKYNMEKIASSINVKKDDDDQIRIGDVRWDEKYSLREDIKKLSNKEGKYIATITEDKKGNILVGIKPNSNSASKLKFKTIEDYNNIIENLQSKYKSVIFEKGI